MAAGRVPLTSKGPCDGADLYSSSKCCFHEAARKLEFSLVLNLFYPPGAGSDILIRRCDIRIKKHHLYHKPFIDQVCLSTRLSRSHCVFSNFEGWVRLAPVLLDLGKSSPVQGEPDAVTFINIECW